MMQLTECFLYNGIYFWSILEDSQGLYSEGMILFPFTLNPVFDSWAFVPLWLHYAFPSASQ